MIRSTLSALGLLALLSASAFAAPIPLGAMGNFAVFTSDGQIFNNNYSTAGTTVINDGQNAGSRFAFGGSDAITFNGGGSFQTVAYAGTEYNAFFALTSTLSSVGGTPIVSWAGLTAGNYTFDGTTLPTSVTLTDPGSYVFTYTGASALALNGVNITLGAGVSSDDVMWYVPNDVSLFNSTFAGVLVVKTFGATVEANGGPTSIQGRVLAESNISLTGWNDGGNLSFNNPAADPGSDVPEPASIYLVCSALAVGAIVRRRQSSR